MWLGIVIISLIGTLAHFVYEWTGHHKIIGLFTAVNESTWEHIKIALTPSLLWGLYDGLVFGSSPNYFLAKLLSLLIIVLLIPAIFYSYKAITKKDILIFDIIIFYLAIMVSQFVFYIVLMLSPVPYPLQYLSCLGLFIFFGCYMTLTLEPLKTFLFKDPTNGKYGFRAHTDLFKKIKSKVKKPKSKK